MFGQTSATSFAGQVAEIEKFELAEGHQNARRTRVFRGVVGPRVLAGAVGVGLGLMPGTAPMCSPSAVSTTTLSPSNINGVARMHDAPPMPRDGLEIGCVVVRVIVGVFAVLAVVQELAHLDTRHQFRYAAHVIVVISA